MMDAQKDHRGCASTTKITMDECEEEEISVVSRPLQGRPVMKRCRTIEERLGYIFESRKEDCNTKFKRLLVTGGLIALTTIVIAFAVALVGVSKFKDTSYFQLRSDDSDENVIQESREVYEDIIKNTVPTIKEWIESNVEDDILPSLYSRPQDRIQPDCFDTWFDGFLEIMPQITPEQVENRLEAFGLLHYPSIVDNFRIELSSPTSTHTFLEGSRDALKSSPIISKMSCVALEYLADGGNVSTTMVLYQEEIRDVLGEAFVLEILTKSLIEDHSLLMAVIESMDGPQKKKFYDFTHNKETSGFYADKYDGIRSSLKLKFKHKAFNDNSIESNNDIKRLQTNILEAVKVDIDRGMTQNARVGISLAAALSTGKVPHGSYAKDHKLTWPLGRNWVDAYISWNMAFILGYGHPRILYKLMIPSVANKMTNEHSADMFFDARLISLAITLMAFDEDSFRLDSPLELAIDFGETNVQMTRLAPVSKENAIDMLFELCDNGKLCASKSRVPFGTFSHDGWSDEEYKVYVGFIVWLTLILTGFGLEAFGLGLMLSSSSVFIGNDECDVVYRRPKRWTPTIRLLWHLAEFLFPILAVVSFGLASHGNYFCVLTTVIGLWKSGFPEVLSYLSAATYGVPNGSIGTAQKLEHFLNGCGMILHHSSASIVVAFVLVGVITPSRDVFDPISILFAQHWFVLLRFISNFGYIFITILLEVWFEWAVISHFEDHCLNHTLAAMAGAIMLVAHWMYLLAACLNLMGPAEVPGQPRKKSARTKISCRAISVGQLDQQPETLNPILDGADTEKIL